MDVIVIQLFFLLIFADVSPLETMLISVSYIKGCPQICGDP